MRIKLLLLVCSISGLFSSCNENKADHLLPELFLNIRYINDAYEIEKALGSEELHFKPGVDLDYSLYNTPSDWEYSIYGKPDGLNKSPSYAIFKRKENYDFPLNVIYVYNPETKVVSNISYEWAPLWWHYGNDTRATAEAIKNWNQSFASTDFYWNKYVELYKYFRSSYEIDTLLFHAYYYAKPKNISEEIKAIKEHFEFRKSAGDGWEDNDILISLFVVADKNGEEHSNTRYPTANNIDFRALSLTFFLKKNMGL